MDVETLSETPVRRVSSVGSMNALARQSTMRGVGADGMAPLLGKKSQGAALAKKSLGEALSKKSQRFGGRKNTPYESARARMNWQNGVKLVCGLLTSCQRGRKAKCRCLITSVCCAAP